MPATVHGALAQRTVAGVARSYRGYTATVRGDAESRE
jgi:hypothetical protein